MSILSVKWLRHLLVVMLASVAFVVTLPGVEAEKVATNQTVAQTVRNHRETCGDLGGAFNTGSWTTPGDKPGTMVTTTFSKCDLGGGDVTTCYHTPGSVDCRSSVTSPTDGRGQATNPDDALADDPFGPMSDVTTPDSVDQPDEAHSGQPDSTTIQPTVEPVADSHG